MNLPFKKLTIAGETYIDSTYWHFGDYVGDSVSRSNFEVLEAMLDDEADMPRSDEDGEYIYGDMIRGDKVELDTIANRMNLKGGALFYRLGGGHGYEGLLIREDWLDKEEILEALENYIILDEAKHEELESKLEEEAFDSWVIYDLRNYLDGLFETEYVRETGRFSPEEELKQRKADDLSDQEIWECFNDACIEVGEYAVHETGCTVYWNIDRIKDAFTASVEARIA